MSQWGILVFSVTAAYMLNDHRPKMRRWGPVFGLLGQPFWMWSTFAAHQWGIFAMTFIYTGMSIRGFYNMWLRK